MGCSNMHNLRLLGELLPHISPACIYFSRKSKLKSPNSLCAFAAGTNSSIWAVWQWAGVIALSSQQPPSPPPPKEDYIAPFHSEIPGLPALGELLASRPCGVRCASSQRSLCPQHVPLCSLSVVGGCVTHVRASAHNLPPHPVSFLSFLFLLPPPSPSPGPLQFLTGL